MAVERKLDLECDSCGEQVIITEASLQDSEWGMVTVETFDGKIYMELVMCPQCIGNNFLMNEGTDED